MTLKLNGLMRLVMLGAPGSGKGTISKRLCDQFQLEYVCSGDLLRAAIRQGSDEGRIADQYIRQGRLVPNDLVTKMTFEQLNNRIGSHRSWLLDGYPRTLEQARLLCDHHPQKVSHAIWLQVPHEEIIRRIQQRLIHPASGRTYHLEYHPPKVAGQDDLTGEPLVQRLDDEENAVKQRLLQFDELTQPVLEFFEERGLLATFQGTESDVLYPQVMEYLVNDLKQQMAVEE